MTVIFIISIGVKALFDTDFTTSLELFEEHQQSESTQAADDSYMALINLTGTNFAPLMGILGGGFYFHNISLPVVRNAKDQTKVNRDIFLGYFFVFLTYVCCGVFGYLGFIGATFADKQPSVKSID